MAHSAQPRSFWRRPRVVRWFAWSYSGVVHAALAAGLLYMVAAGRPRPAPH